MPKRFDNRRQALFCDHYKRTGHTIEKCYKIYGYPSKPQGRGRGGYGQLSSREASNTWTEHSTQYTQALSTESQLLNLLGLNAEQSKQLYQFLSNLTSTSQPQPSEQEVNVANMAGISSILSNT